MGETMTDLFNQADERVSVHEGGYVGECLK